MTTDAHNPADRPPAEPKTTRLYSRGTPVRNVRLDDDTWHRVTAAAETAGLTASDIIRAALDAHLHA